MFNKPTSDEFEEAFKKYVENSPNISEKVKEQCLSSGGIARVSQTYSDVLKETAPVAYQSQFSGPGGYHGSSFNIEAINDVVSKRISQNRNKYYSQSSEFLSKADDAKKRRDQLIKEKEETEKSLRRQYEDAQKMLNSEVHLNAYTDLIYNNKHSIQSYAKNPDKNGELFDLRNINRKKF